jgi:hypothetical protein
MTCIPLDVLDRRRSEGLSPQRGVADAKEAAALCDFATLPKGDRTAKKARLDALLVASWNHPIDQQLLDGVSTLVGRQCVRAEILMAADYRYRQQTGKREARIDPNYGKTQYEALCASLQK